MPRPDDDEQSMSALGPLGPILGDEACPHIAVSYYNGIEGVYGVCAACRGHFWYATPPAGVEVIDLDGPDDDPVPDECSHGIPVEDDCEQCEELTRAQRAYGRTS